MTVQMDTPNPPLSSRRLRLEPLVEAHAERLFPLLADEELYRHLDHGPPADLARLQEVYRQLQQRRSPEGDELWLNWVLCGIDDADAVGYVQATVMGDGRCWVAWVLARTAWGRGLATEAAAAMLQHLAGLPGAHQALACVDADNLRSVAVALRLGFAEADAATHAALGLEATERLFTRALQVPADPGRAA